VGTLARRPQGGGPARSVDLYPNAILFTAVPPYEGTNGAAVHSVDIPKLNTLIVLDMHRFGAASLHQLRGRVGRRKTEAHAYLLHPPLETLADKDGLHGLCHVDSRRR
jgi:hypothetical protein